MQIIQKISVDFGRGDTPVTVYAKQDDRKSRYIEITPLDNGRPYVIDDGVTARLQMTKPDGCEIYNDAVIIDGKIVAELTQQVLAEVGVVVAEIGLYKDGAVLSSQIFYVNVTWSACDKSDITSSDEFGALVDALDRADKLANYAGHEEGAFQTIPQAVAEENGYPGGAYGKFSFAAGYNANANGAGAAVTGTNNTANGENTLVSGADNVCDTHAAAVCGAGNKVGSDEDLFLSYGVAVSGTNNEVIECRGGNVSGDSNRVGYRCDRTTVIGSGNDIGEAIDSAFIGTGNQSCIYYCCQGDMLFLDSPYNGKYPDTPDGVSFVYTTVCDGSSYSAGDSVPLTIKAGDTLYLLDADGRKLEAYEIADDHIYLGPREALAPPGWAIKGTPSEEIKQQAAGVMITRDKTSDLSVNDATTRYSLVVGSNNTTVHARNCLIAGIGNKVNYNLYDKYQGTSTPPQDTNTTFKGYWNPQFLLGVDLRSLKYLDYKPQLLTGVLNNYLNSSSSISSIAFSIGNGSKYKAWNKPSYTETRSNAFTVTYSGGVYTATGGSYNSSGAGWGEMYEWADGNPENEDRVGCFVTTQGKQIVKANAGDYILGVTSSGETLVTNNPMDWHSRYVTDDFGRIQYHEVDVPEERDNDGNILIPEHKENIPLENPDYDPERNYSLRSERSEYSIVCMGGQVRVRDDGTCKVDGYCTVGTDGVATSSDSGYRVIERVADNIIVIIMR